MPNDSMNLVAWLFEEIQPDRLVYFAAFRERYRSARRYNFSYVWTGNGVDSGQ